MKRVLWGVIAAQLLTACAGKIIPSSASVRPPPTAPVESAAKPQPVTPIAPVASTSASGTTARSTGVVAGPTDLPISETVAARALGAFRLSCVSLTRRTDRSGLTTGADWAPACSAAAGVGAGDAVRFFRDRFETVQIGSGAAFATGYYEPEIAGSRTKRAGYEVPVYRKPNDIVGVDLGAFSDELAGKRISGRVKGGSLVPYFDRTEIEGGALSGRGLEIAWAADPVELFFLQIQGSGRLKLPDGGIMRIGYDGQNGRDYTGIGTLMRARGLLQPGQTSMQGLMAYLRANPEEGRAIMRENKSWVFFRELTGSGPVGAMGVVVTGQASVAADPAFVPLGAPVFLSMDRADATGLWIAQDTGGAIKGANRFDTFWGAGDEARRIAGGMSARGTAFLLLPKGVRARLTADGGPTP